jgi:drug/metabolite transporter (DMT)-like permease
MNWFLLAILASLFLSFSMLAQKNIFKRIKISPLAAIALFQLLTGFMFITLLPFSKVKYPADFQVWLRVPLLICFYAVGNVFYMKGVERISASEIGLLFASQPVWIFLGSVLFLGEDTAPVKLVGILLVRVGLVAVYFKGKLRWSFYHSLTALASIIISAAMVVDRFLIDYFSPVFYSSIAWTLPGLIDFSLPGVRREAVGLSKRDWSVLTLPSIFATLFGLSLLGSYQSGGEASRVGAILRLSTIFTIILGYFVFNEKQEIVRKLIGGVIVVAGVVLLR